MTRPKSVEIPKETLAAFRKYVKGFRYLADFLREESFDRVTTRRILKGDTVSPDTLEKVQQLVEKQKTAA